MLKLVALFAMLIGGCLQNMSNAQFSSDGRGRVSPWRPSTAPDVQEHVRRPSLPGRFRVPGEFEPHEYLLMACSGDHVHSKTIARIIREIDGSIHPVVLARDVFDRQQLLQDLEEYGVDIDEVAILHVQHDSKWCRDFGPTSLVSCHEVQLLDWTYSDDRRQDDDVSMRLAMLSKTRAQFTPLSFEGGNLLSNGQGLVLTSEKFVFQNIEYHARQTTEELRKQLGADQLLVLEPLSGEGTAHVDMFATFTSPNTVVVGSYDPRVDPINAEILDRNAQSLERVLTRNGRLSVVRIPMGSREGDCWRTYTNCIYANGVLIVPSYGEYDDPEVLQQVIETYRDLLPEWRVTTVDARSLIDEGGALRCASLNICRLNCELESTHEFDFPAVPENSDLSLPHLERVPLRDEDSQWNLGSRRMPGQGLDRRGVFNQQNSR